MNRWLLILAAIASLASSSVAHAMCDVIPGVKAQYRGALGTVDRPFAIPGDDGQRIEIRLGVDGCDAASPGFAGTSDDFLVTVLFKPPGGVSNAVVLHTTASAGVCAAALGVAPALPPGGVATCREVLPSNLQVMDSATLRMVFPDTDAELAPDGDDVTFTGPTVIAVTATTETLPFDLASARCADTPGLVACIDELYARDGTCQNIGTALDPVFGHFTALPPANNYQGLCTTISPTSPCEPVSPQDRNLRFTVDADGNALIPMDYRGVLVTNDRIPIPRVVLGDTNIDAFAGMGLPVQLPNASFIASFSPGGHRLPPIFEPINNPDETNQLNLFGTVDAPIGVIRVTRRGCVGGPTEGLSCIDDLICGGGTCTELFDFSDRLSQGGTGPVLLADPDFDLDTENPVPLDGLIQSSDLFAFVVSEAIDGVQLNADIDSVDPVIVLRDRTTGIVQPIGKSGATGRAITRVRSGRWRFPAVAVEDDLVAFLESEPLEGDCVTPATCDANADGDVFDSILRVFRLDPSGATELTISNTAVDADPLVNGRSLVLSDGLVYFRVPETASAPHSIVRVTVDSSGTESDEDDGGGGGFFYGAPWTSPMSHNGRSVVFTSDATNLVSSDTNGFRDVFVHDRDANENGAFDEDPGMTPNAIATSRVSLDENHAQTTAELSNYIVLPAISANGRFVSFNSSITNLVTGDANGSSADIFVHDRDADNNGIFDEDPMTVPNAIALTRVSKNSLGTQANNGSSDPYLSEDGRFVAFSSLASNLDLVRPDTNSARDIFVHDRNSGETTRVNISTAGIEMSGVGVGASHPSLSLDGRFVTWLTNGEDLVPDDDNGRSDVFVHDRDTDEDGVFDEPSSILTERVSVDSSGNQVAGNDANKTTPISADGRFVAFGSEASTLVAGDTNGLQDVFLHDRLTGETLRVSLTSSGDQGTYGNPETAALSANGRLIAFATPGSLVAQPAQGIHVHDRLTGHTQIISFGLSGAADNQSYTPAISADGRFISFKSPATNLVPGDTNSAADVFVHGPDTSILASDSTGDLDLDDTVLHVFDPDTATLTPLCPAEDVAVSNGNAAFLRPEAAGDAPNTSCPVGIALDLNGDADSKDAVVHLSLSGSAPQNLKRAATAIALSGDWLAALVSESGQSAIDRNGDGDTNDRVLAINELNGISELTWINVGKAADTLDVLGSTIAFISPEASQGQDLNNDGDLLDRVLQILRAEAGLPAGLISVGQSAEEFVLGQNLVAFRTREAAQGSDLNGDGDLQDDVLQVYDLVSNQLFNTEQAVTPCPLEACDPRIPYRVDGDTVTFITAELDQGGPLAAVGCQPTGTPGECDLNGDGDASDLVKQVFNAREAANHSILLAGACVDSVASANGGICSDTGDACADDASCPTGTCFLPPGQCTADLATTCASNNSCGSGEFCATNTSGVMTCHKNQGPCAEQTDCTHPTDPGVCLNASADIQRLFSPVSTMGTAGSEILFSSGTCIEDISADSMACATNEDCPTGTTCGVGLTCEGLRRHGSCLSSTDCAPGDSCVNDLVIIAAADTDLDGLADPFDNCLHAANINQADLDSDGIGDACDLMTCSDNIRSSAEQCDDGNLVDGDGCSATCTIEIVSTWLFGGVAAGGMIDFTVEGVVLQIVTLVGETPAEVAANVAAAINADPTLQSLAIAASASADLVIANGLVYGVTINDSGLTHELGPISVPSMRGPLILLLTASILMVALARLRRSPASGTRY